MSDSVFDRKMIEQERQPSTDAGAADTDPLAVLVQAEVQRQLQGTSALAPPVRPSWMSEGRDLAPSGSLIDHYGTQIAQGRVKRLADAATSRASLRGLQRRRLVLERRVERLEKELADARRATATPVPLVASLFHARALTVALAAGAGIRSLLPSVNEKDTKSGSALSLPLLAAFPVALFVGEREVRQEQARQVTALQTELEMTQDRLADLPEPWEADELAFAGQAARAPGDGASRTSTHP